MSITTGEELRNGLFALHKRRFGRVLELMIQRIVDLGKAKNIFHDLYDDLADQRVEVKFCRVLRCHEAPISEGTVLLAIEEALGANRSVASHDVGVEFDCNIQQIKKPEFDVSYYGLLFADRVEIFRIEPGQIDGSIGYSNFQHKGNAGEGPFHITNANIATHRANHAYQTLTYEELLQLLTP